MRKNIKIISSTKAKKISKVIAENLDGYIEDIIFIKHFYSMAYIDTLQCDSMDFKRKY